MNSKDSVKRRNGCGYKEIYARRGIMDSGAAPNLLNIQVALDAVPINTVKVAEFDSKAVALPSLYSAPTIKGLFTRVPTGYALISNMTFGSRTVQFMAVDGSGISENMCANQSYIASRVNGKSLRPIVLPALTGLSRNDKSKIDAYAGSIWNTMCLWDTFGRVGIFDESHVYLSIVNVNIDNAFWNGYYMTYGVGYGTMDVVGHESGHGVIQALGGLDYKGEAGALNESIADILGTCLEKYYDIRATKTLFDWSIGEDIYGQGFRSFSDPKANGQPSLYLGNLWVNTKNVGSSNDYGGVHTNSGVNNFFFYIVSTGAKGKNEKGLNYNVKVAFPIFMLSKFIYLSLKGESGYKKILSSSNYSQYALCLLGNISLFLSQNKALSPSLGDSLNEGFMATGILKAPISVKPIVLGNGQRIQFHNVKGKCSNIIAWILFFLIILAVMYFMMR